MENSKKVCIIEDNKPIQKLLSTILEKSGLSTIAFSDGESALNWLKVNAPLVVLVDYVLPDLDGEAIINFIRELPDGNSIPVIAVTGLAQENDKEKIMNLGFDSYISKPIQTANFANQVKEVINQKSN